MFDKLKNRTEWQAFLVTVIALFADHFFGLEIDEDKLWMLVGAFASYATSRGIAKRGTRVEQLPADKPSETPTEEPGD